MSPATDAGRERDHVIERTVANEAWRRTVAESLCEGWRFAGLWASEETVGRTVRAALLRGTDFLVLSSRVNQGTLDSIVGLVQAADWENAIEALDLCDKRKMIEDKVAKRRRAVLMTAQAQKLERERRTSDSKTPSPLPSPEGRGRQGAAVPRGAGDAERLPPSPSGRGQG